MNSLKYLIAGGGTGGHLFPGIAVARELEKRFDKAEILFVTGRKQMESDIVARYGYRTTSIDVQGLKGRGLKKGITTLMKLPGSMFQSAVVIKSYSPCLILGMGGYSAGPVCLAGKVMGVPTAIHEQNSYPGLTNRLLSRFVDKVFISFEESREYFKDRELILTGNPVREDLISGQAIPETDQRFTILVMGGSQGAMAINRAFGDALICLRSMGKTPYVIHQTGKNDYDTVAKFYRENGLPGEVVPFIEDMAGAYGKAHLVLSRAGATTIFELAALGKPSVLIPYPYAANQHQKINAGSLVRAGAAEMILQADLTGKGLAGVLIKYMDNRSALNEMGKRALSLGRPDAAGLIVDQLEKQTKT